MHGFVILDLSSFWECTYFNPESMPFWAMLRYIFMASFAG
jgi:hypothetical protein